MIAGIFDIFKSYNTLKKAKKFQWKFEGLITNISIDYQVLCKF